MSPLTSRGAHSLFPLDPEHCPSTLLQEALPEFPNPKPSDTSVLKAHLTWPLLRLSLLPPPLVDPSRDFYLFAVHVCPNLHVKVRELVAVRSPSITWVLGTELRSSGLVVSTLDR